MSERDRNGFDWGVWNSASRYRPPSVKRLCCGLRGADEFRRRCHLERQSRPRFESLGACCPKTPLNGVVSRQIRDRKEAACACPPKRWHVLDRPVRVRHSREARRTHREAPGAQTNSGHLPRHRWRRFTGLLGRRRVDSSRPLWPSRSTAPSPRAVPEPLRRHLPAG